MLHCCLDACEPCEAQLPQGDGGCGSAGLDVPPPRQTWSSATALYLVMQAGQRRVPSCEFLLKRKIDRKSSPIICGRMAAAPPTSPRHAAAWPTQHRPPQRVCPKQTPPPHRHRQTLTRIIMASFCGSRSQSLLGLTTRGGVAALRCRTRDAGGPSLGSCRPAIVSRRRVYVCVCDCCWQLLRLKRNWVVDVARVGGCLLPELQLQRPRHGLLLAGSSWAPCVGSSCSPPVPPPPGTSLQNSCSFCPGPHNPTSPPRPDPPLLSQAASAFVHTP